MNRFEETTLRYAAAQMYAPPSALSAEVFVAVTSELGAGRGLFGRAFGAYALRTASGLAVSCVPELEATTREFARAYATSQPRGAALADGMARAYGRRVRHGYKYAFSGRVPESAEADALDEASRGDFMAFFHRMHPDSEGDQRLETYYTQIVRSGCGRCVRADGAIVAVCETAEAAFLPGEVVELGVRTLEGCRRRGYSYVACASSIRALLARGLCPMWSTSAGNIASQALAAKLGFERTYEAYRVDAIS